MNPLCHWVIRRDPEVIINGTASNTQMGILEHAAEAERRSLNVRHQPYHDYAVDDRLTRGFDANHYT